MSEFETALSLRLRVDAGPEGRRLSARFDGYAMAEGDDVAHLGGLRGELNEAFLSFTSSRCGASLGVRRYPDQYWYYWNPTFLPQRKVDLRRPDYLAAGISTAAVGCRAGRLSPKLLVAWDSDDTFPGVQVNGYFGQTEGYVNAFVGVEAERTVGTGLRFGLGSWTLQAEGCLVWNHQRPRPWMPAGRRCRRRAASSPRPRMSWVSWPWA